MSACVSSDASPVGLSRSGAMASMTSTISPETKRSASTLPSSCFAAMSPRVGVRRGSSIAFAQQSVDGARGLAFAAFGPRRLCRRRPAVDVEMQPTLGVLDEALQEQRAGDRADLGIEPAVISRPQRHAPHRIVLLEGTSGDILRQLLILGVEGR